MSIIQDNYRDAGSIYFFSSCNWTFLTNIP